MSKIMVQKEAVNTSPKVQSIDRALAILETLADYPSLSLMELSEKVHLHKATTQWRTATSIGTPIRNSTAFP
jgi:hypothetical protein